MDGPLGQSRSNIGSENLNESIDRDIFLLNTIYYLAMKKSQNLKNFNIHGIWSGQQKITLRISIGQQKLELNHDTIRSRKS